MLIWSINKNVIKGIISVLFFTGLSFYIYTNPGFFFDGFGYETLKAIGFSLAIVGCAFLIEAVIVGWRGSSVYSFINPTPSHKRDLVIFLCDISRLWFLFGKLATAGLPFFLGAWMGQKLAGNGDFRFVPRIPFVPLQIFVHLLLSEFTGYWLHRTFHRVSFLWPLHEYHHSATSFNILTARRDHPLVVPFFSIFTGLIPAVLGVPAFDMYWIGVLMTLHAFLIHSQLKNNWGWIGRWLFVSPKGHLFHHSSDPKHFNKNFGFMTPFWDQVFGTFYLGPETVTEIGVCSDVYNKVPIYSEMWIATVRFVQILSSRIKMYAGLVSDANFLNIGKSRKR